MEEVVVLTRIVPGGPGNGQPHKPKRGLKGEAKALGVTQMLMGALQTSLGAALLAALQDPFSTQLGVPVGTGVLFMVTGAVLLAAAGKEAVGLARAALALSVLSAVLAVLQLVMQGVLLPNGCGRCWAMAPHVQGAVLGAQALLALGAATEVGLAVGGAVAAGRALAGRGQVPLVLYQTAPPPTVAPPTQEAGPAVAPPTGSAPQ
ncbi:uncharacterized protein LOC107050532 isoform X1 [Gallus gallus]|nr:uncharacterized protein LOC107050532 isoform X1 [Gallus gallus]XP_040513024.1 uncharacterized protein LOC107050532 isoform X1 [Gallus gallus]XP_040513025.1 uncharacterized protein LOC107050532 isoform X1 [Gallus gallus]XP_040513026.1 uncharacterized protein LOC107050532 isoform X1 [Gallus gallus]XP_040551117.1 uncharacterized protein LOC107050532 isoform X1 [Gallus gallus]XP_040551118.1 uncharacterized protein LOC107050532 isoform X1 [Gallus gallus]XP_040551119.1 uncharacterized protein LO